MQRCSATWHAFGRRQSCDADLRVQQLRLALRNHQMTCNTRSATHGCTTQAPPVQEAGKDVWHGMHVNTVLLGTQ